jgi:peptidyl-prolyl cis-trans isomerase A (cyclophilin A)
MLLPEQAPQTVAHFAALAEGWMEWTDPVSGEKISDPYYDGARVYRAEAGSRFEAGDARSDGRTAPMLYVPPETGGPYSFHSGYMLGMTRYTSARISAVQFFVTASSQPFLTGSHPCFGKVVEGQDVIFDISAVKTYSNGRPIDPITIDEIRIFKVGDPAPLEEPQPYTPKRYEMQRVGETGAKPGSL